MNVTHGICVTCRISSFLKVFPVSDVYIRVILLHSNYFWGSLLEHQLISCKWICRLVYCASLITYQRTLVTLICYTRSLRRPITQRYEIRISGEFTRSHDTFQLFQIVLLPEQRENCIPYMVFVFAHFYYMFICNYMGQKIIDHSTRISKKTWVSWAGRQLRVCCF